MSGVGAASTGPGHYPVHVEGRLDLRLSRWLWLVKWLLVIPHLVVLAFLWVAFAVLTLVAFVAILATGRYPRRIFEFNVGVLRWSWRVAYYTYAANGTDRYPPFGLAELPDYPARLTVDYPQQLSRGLALVKWWLLAVPHYLVIGLFVGGGYVAWRSGGAGAPQGGIGLIGILVLVAAVVLLVRGAYPQPLFDLVLGLDRWVLRVAAYAGLMTDRYPPFRLDQGGADPTVTIEREEPPGPVAAQPSWGTGAIVGVVVAALAIVGSLGLLAGGSAALVVDRAARGADGYVMTGSQRVASAGYAVTAEGLDLRVEGPGWLYPPEQLGRVRVSAAAEGGSPVFVGIAPTADVAAYLSGVPYDEVARFEDSRLRYRGHAGSARPAPPSTQSFWAASAAGPGSQALTWPVRSGDWSVVVMNADAAPNVAAAVRAGALLPHLGALAGGLLATGGLLLLAGALGLAFALRSK